MKTYILKSIMVLLAIGVFNACSWDPITFDSSKSFVAFPSKSVKVAENVASIEIPVVVAATKGSPSVTVNFEIVTEGSTAVEGQDFEIGNASKSLTFSEGLGTQNIVINPVDNDLFEGNKSFTIKLVSNSANYALGAIDQMAVTLVDDEHPLATWIGTYNVEAKSYLSPGAWDEFYSGVKTSPDEEDVDYLVIEGYAMGTKSFRAKFDKEAMTITINPKANCGDAYGYGDVEIYKGTPDGTLEESEQIIGVLSADGSIHIDYVAMVLTGANAGYVWDVFDTYWTKQ